MMQEAINKMDDWMTDIAEQTAADALETRDVNHNKTFIKAALRSVVNGLLVSILDNSAGTKKSFGDAIIQVATTQKSLAIIALAGAKDIVCIASIARYAARL